MGENYYIIDVDYDQVIFLCGGVQWQLKQNIIKESC